MLPFDKFLEKIEKTDIPDLEARLVKLESYPRSSEEGAAEWAQQTKESIATLRAVLSYERARNA